MSPRVSSLSTIPVTFEASQNMVSASELMATGWSGSRLRSACPWVGVRSISVQMAIHHPFVLTTNSISVDQSGSGSS
jgi:hypothetical protein